jgi:UDP-GlcNAc:undecaprenyl-phosphate GlcNAc-1-phosphate transferase
LGQGWRLTLFIDWSWLTAALSVVWIVALVNAFNMLDNMDGLSAGVATIACISLAAGLLMDGGNGVEPQLFVAGFLLVLAGSLLGFLWHNRPPARLYMGDAGSYFVGYSLAVATLVGDYTRYDGLRPHAVLFPLCVMAVPLYDLISVVWIRLREGRSVFQGDTRHFSHRLVALGLSRPQAVMVICLVSAMCSTAGLLLTRVGPVAAVAIGLCVLALLLSVARLESRSKS